MADQRASQSSPGLLASGLVRFLERRSVIAIVTVLIGTGAFGWIQHSRDQHSALRENSIDFLEEVANRFNAVITPLTAQIRLGEDGVRDDIQEAIDHLFEMRMAVRIKSQAYLRDEEFQRACDEAMWELRDLAEVLKKLGESPATKIDVAAKRKEIESLEKKWNIHFTPSADDRRPGAEPYDTLYLWIVTVWMRVNQLVSDALVKVM